MTHPLLPLSCGINVLDIEPSPLYEIIISAFPPSYVPSSCYQFQARANTFLTDEQREQIAQTMLKDSLLIVGDAQQDDIRTVKPYMAKQEFVLTYGTFIYKNDGQKDEMVDLQQWMQLSVQLKCSDTTLVQILCIHDQKCILLREEIEFYVSTLQQLLK